MKNKIRLAIILITITLIVSLLSCYNVVQAVDSEPEGQNQTTEEESTSGDGEWTDFSKAQFSLKKDGKVSATIEISGVTPKEKSSYYLFITSNGDKPNVTQDSDGAIPIGYDTDSKIFNPIHIEGYVERNQDLYINILEHYYDEGIKENVVVYGKKIDRYEEPKYNEAFFSTHMSYNSTQIVTNFTHGKENPRKMQIKIGKITDYSILQKIKDQGSSGFADLLNYAKTNSGIYDQMVDLSSDYAIAYESWDGDQVIDLKPENGAYYYLYVKTDDENGKYISNESVTFAGCDIPIENQWYMFFYGDDDFEWPNFHPTSAGGGDVTSDSSDPSSAGTGDTTTAKGILPNTGKDMVIWFGIGIITTASGVIFYRKYKKYQGI